MLVYTSQSYWRVLPDVYFSLNLIIVLLNFIGAYFSKLNAIYLNFFVGDMLSLIKKDQIICTSSADRIKSCLLGPNYRNYTFGNWTLEIFVVFVDTSRRCGWFYYWSNIIKLFFEYIFSIFLLLILCVLVGLYFSEPRTCTARGDYICTCTSWKMIFFSCFASRLPKKTVAVHCLLRFPRCSLHGANGLSAGVTLEARWGGRAGLAVELWLPEILSKVFDGS
jgi:hypothetical protein